MKPYYEHEGITIYHADARVVMPYLWMRGVGPVDLLLTDPPYGLGIAANPVRQAHDVKDWDNLPVDASLLTDAIKFSQKQIIWGGNYFGLPSHQCFLVWDKVQPDQGFSLAMCEQAWTNLKRPAKMFRYRVVGYVKEHPTEKPVALFKWCIGLAGDVHTICDPFMGSGTTLEAAKDLGLSAIGIEIEERYCEIAAKRLSQEVLQF